MIRYLRTIRQFISTSLAAEMEYRMNFVLSVASSLMMLAGTLYGLHLLFKSGYKPGGWTLHEAMLPVGLYFLLDGIAACVLQPNLSRIVEHVREGTLDFVLLKPIDTQFWLSTRNSSLWGLPRIFFGVAVVLFGGLSRDPAVTPAAFLVGLAAIAAGIIVLYSIWFMLGTLTIWFVKIYNITEALRSMMEAGKFPMGAYEPFWRVLFTFIIPVAFMTTVPAQVILQHEHHDTWLIAAFGLAAGLLLASRLFFRFAMRYYTSASS